MVAIFTGSGSGFERGSANILGSRGLLGASAFGRSGEQLFLNAATGNFLASRSDEFLVGRGPDISVTRTYNSLGNLSDDNGDNWRQSTDRRIFGLTGTANAAGSTVKRRSGDGSEITYAWNGSAYIATDGSGAYDKLVYSSGANSWTWTDGDTRWSEIYSAYNSEWRIATQADTSGNALAFSYYAGTNNLYRVTTADGGYEQYNWSGNNITEIVTGYTDLATATAKTLTRTRYAYDGSNRLTSVITDLSPENNSVASETVFATSYTYDGASKRVASITQSDGSAIAITYDGSGRVATFVQTAAAGVTRTTTIAYGSGSTSITDATGQVTTLEYNADGSLKKITAPPAYTGATAQTVQFGYDANGNLASVTDAAAQVSSYTYDASGNILTSTDPLGSIVTRTYSATNRVLTETRTGSDKDSAAAAHTTRYAYDGADRLTYTVSAEGRVTRYWYLSTGENYWVSDFPDQIYDVSALGASVAVTDSQLNSWAAGLSETSSTEITYMQYDARGNMTRRLQGAQNTGYAWIDYGAGYSDEYFAYDQTGRLLSRYTYGQASETFVYDGLGRLTASTDLNGGTTSLVFNDAAMQTVVTLASGLVQTSTYNKAGELVGFTESGAFVTAGAASYQYDKNGRLRMTTDATGINSYVVYDKAGRKIADINHYGWVSEYRYDANNRLVGTANYALDITTGSTTLATLGNPDSVVEMSALRPAAHSYDLWSWTVYDADGRVAETIAGDGSVRAYTYDASDRLVKTTSYVNKLSAAQVAGFRTTSPTSVVLPTAHANDSVARTFYDKDGNRIGLLDGEGYLTRTVYDKAGRRVQEIAYATATNPAYRVSGTFQNLIDSVGTATGDRNTRYVYDGEGQLRYTIDGLGGVTEFGYESTSGAGTPGVARKQIGYAATLGALASYTYAAVKAAIASAGMASNAANRTNWAIYNPAGLLAYSIDATGAVIGYSYDNRGQATKKVEYATLRATSSLPSQGDMDSWAAANAANAANRVTRNYYSARGELRFVVDAEGFVTRNDYTAEGQLAASYRWDTAVSANDGWTIATVNGAVSGTYVGNLFYYDASGHLQYEYDGENNLRIHSYYATSQQAYEYAAYGTVDQSMAVLVYDQAGQLIQRYDAYGTPEQTLTQYAYDGLGNLVSVIDPKGHVTSYAYDRLGNKVSETDAAGGVTAYQYDAFGNAVKVTDARGNATYNYFDKLGRLVSSRDAEDYVTESSYTVFGEVASVTRRANKATNTAAVGTLPVYTADAARDATTSLEYDKLGRLTKSTDALGNYEQYTLNAFGGRVTARNKLGGITTNTFDRRGLLVSEAGSLSGDYGSGGGGVSSVTIINSFEYDARGNRTKTIEGYGTADARTTRYFYDKADRLIEARGMTVAVGFAGTSATPSTYYHYDARGNLTETVDPAGARTLLYYDDLDRRTVQIDALGTYTSFTYDAAGNMTGTRIYATQIAIPGTAGGTPPAAPSGAYRETTYTYDNIDRMLTSSVAGQLIGAWNGTSFATATGALTTSYQYDANGNVITTTASDGGQIFAYYDKLGRKTAQIDQELYRTDWSYDAESNVASERRYATRAAGTPATTAPLAVGTSADDRVTSFTYDKLGRRLTESRAGVVAWSLNANGTLGSATGTATVTYLYNALGEVTRKTEATGEYIDYAYDNAGRLIVETRAGFADYAAATVRPTVRYYYNALNNITSTRQGREAFASDDRISTNSYGASTGGRLETSTDSIGNVHTFVYDIAGRVIGDRYARDTGGASGVVQEGVSTVYDALGRTVRQSINSVSGSTWTEISYSQTAYNAFGEVSQRGANGLWQEQFSYDGAGRLIRANAGDGVWRHYIYDAASRLTMAIESEGMDLSQMSQATALSYAYADTVNATITAYDKRGEATKAIQTQRELSVGGTRQNLIVERGYNAFGEMAWEKDALLNQTDYAYNTMGRRIQAQHPTVAAVNQAGVSTNLRPTERFYYDLSGRLIGSEDANSVAAGSNLVSTRKLLAGTGYGNADGLVVKEWHLDTGVVSQGFDVFGDLRVKTDEVGRATQFVYDKLSRLTQLTRPGGLVESYAYDALGQRIAHWNSVVGYAGRETTEYDALGRIVRETAFGGDVTTTSFSWSATIQASGFLGAGSPVPGGWQTTTTYANGKTVVESADLYGHVVSHTDMGGHVTTYGYDRAGRLTSRAIGTYSCVYDYLNTGMLGAITVGVDTSASQVAFTQDRTVYSYDKNGNRLTEEYSQKAGYWQEYGHYEYEYYYGYDQYWVVDGSDYVTSTTVIAGSTATYDAMNRLSSWTATVTATTPGSSIAYAYDANSNIRRSTATFRMLDQYGSAYATASTQDYWYRFDLMNRVVTAKGVLSGGTIVRGYQGADYMYDLAGQRRTMTTTTTAYGEAMGEVYDPYYGYTWGYVSVPYDADHREDYSYTSDGQLLTVRIAESGYVDNGDGTVSATAAPATGALKSTYTYDTLGRQTRQLDYLGDGDYSSTAAYDRQTTYNAKGQIASEIINQRQGADTLVTSTTNYFTDAGGYALGAVTSSTSYTTKNGSWYSSNSTTNGYGWWDGSQIASTNIVSSVSGGPSTNYTTSYAYTATGVLSSAYIGDGQPRYVGYTNDMLGQVIRRDEGYAAPHEVWYRFAGRTLGYTGNNGTLNTDYQSSIYARTATPGNGLFQGGSTYAQPYGDFDQSLAPINSYGHGSSGGSYTAKGGETLAAIASQVWGDASLWYKIAEANGLSGSETLSVGQVLMLPGGVSRSTHNAATFNPYDPAAAIGDTSPTAPQPQQPAKAKKKGCGVFGAILLIVIAVAVSVVTAGAAAAALTPGLSLSGGISVALGGTAVLGAGAGALAGVTVAATTAGMALFGAIGAVAGSIVSQGIGVATGLQDKFSWGAVAMAGISGGIGGGLGGIIKGAGFLAGAARGAVGSALTQGIGVATGLQKKFDWAGVAAAAVGGGVGAWAGHELGAGSLVNNPSLRNVGASLLTSAASAIANAATRSVVAGTDFGDNLMAALPDVIGSTIGNLIAGGIAEAQRKAQLRSAVRLALNQDVPLMPGQSPVMSDAATPMIPYQPTTLSAKQVAALRLANVDEGRIAAIDRQMAARKASGDPSRSEGLSGGDRNETLALLATDDAQSRQFRRLDRDVQYSLIDTDPRVIAVRGQIDAAIPIDGGATLTNISFTDATYVLATHLGLYDRLHMPSASAATNVTSTPQVVALGQDRATRAAALLAAARAAAPNSTGPVLPNVLGDDQKYPGLRAFAYNISEVTTEAKVDGQLGNHEKLLSIERTATGYAVTRITIVGSQGGQNISVARNAIAILHSHQRNDPPPGDGDPASSWLRNPPIPNFQVGGIGHGFTLTEVGRFNDQVLFTKIGPGGTAVRTTTVQWGTIPGTATFRDPNQATPRSTDYVP